MAMMHHMTGSTTTFHTTASRVGTPLTPRMARAMPSGTQLPRTWKKEHDRFICQCDALGDVEIRTIVRGLKKKFAIDLGNTAISCESVERRILALDQQENDYFVQGMRTAVRKAEAAGFVLPQMDFEIYAVMKEESHFGPQQTAAEPFSEASANWDPPPRIRTPQTPIMGTGSLGTPNFATSGGRVRLVEDSEDSQATVKQIEYEKENRDYIIPINRMEGLPASGTSALLARRAGLKDSGSVASLSYSNNTASTSAFDAVGQGSRIPRSSSMQHGHLRKSSGVLQSNTAFTGPIA